MKNNYSDSKYSSNFKFNVDFEDTSEEEYKQASPSVRDADIESYRA